jgi:LacI family transcriptional regulator
MASRSVTIKDIARVAGVATGTVSKALNGSPEISEVTRARVTEIATRLGYRPNAIARSLKVNRTRTLGVITNDTDGTFTTAMVRGIAEVASDHDVGVFLCNSYGRVAKERQHVELLLDKQVDGMVMIGYKVEERGAPAAPIGTLPIVYLYEYTSAADWPCILPDDEGGARLATSHLFSIGRRRVAFVNGPPSYEATTLRLAGYLRELEEHGMARDLALVRAAPDWNQDSGFRLATELMRLPDPPDALFCANDDLAAGAVLGLRDLGLRVPDDVSVVGFDDRPFAAHLPVPLTTVAMPLNEMGTRAAHTMFAAIGGEPLTNERIHVPCDLVVRASCGGDPEGPAGRRSTTAETANRT